MSRVLSSLRDGVVPSLPPSEKQSCVDDASPSTSSSSPRTSSCEQRDQHLRSVCGLGAEWKQGRERPQLVCVTRSPSTGLGLRVVDGQPAVLVDVEPLGPAYAAGIRDNDQCLAVNGVLVLQLSAQSLTQLFETCEDEYVKLLVLQRTQPRPFLPALVPWWNQPFIDAFGFDLRADDDDAEDITVGLQRRGSQPANDKQAKQHSAQRRAEQSQHAEEEGKEQEQEEPPGTQTRQQHQQHQQWKQGCRVETNTGSTSASSDAAQERIWADFLAAGKLCTATDPHWTSTVHAHGNDEQWHMLLKGVPHRLRPRVWMGMTRAAQLKDDAPLRYDEIVMCGVFEIQPTLLGQQIRKDLVRSFPTNVFFSTAAAEGTHRLHRVLLASAWYRPAIGYCQGLGMLVAHMLLLLEEEHAFWLLQAILSDLVPADFYGGNLLGAITDQRVLRELIQRHVPDVSRAMDTCSVELSLITLNWFLTAFAGVANMDLSLRIWDCFLFENAITLFKVSLSLVTTFAAELTEVQEDLGAFMRLISSLPVLASQQIDHVMQLSYAFQVIEAEIPPLRREHRERLQREYEDYRQRMDELHASRDSTEEAPVELQGISFWQRLVKRKASGTYLTGLTEKEMKDSMTQLGEAIQHVMVAAAEHPEDSEEITLLVHNSLCAELARVLRAGLCVTEATHPWAVIQAVVAAVLDDVIRWQQLADESYTVQLLRQHAATFAAAVRSIDQAHKRVDNSDLNVKLRSMICLGLNGGELHAWIRVLSLALRSSPDLKRFYSSGSSPLRNPYFAKQIELHLGALMRNTRFHLAVDMEWTPSSPQRKAVV